MVSFMKRLVVRKSFYSVIVVSKKFPKGLMSPFIKLTYASFSFSTTLFSSHSTFVWLSLLRSTFHCPKDLSPYRMSSLQELSSIISDMLLSDEACIAGAVARASSRRVVNISSSYFSCYPPGTASCSAEKLISLIASACKSRSFSNMTTKLPRSYSVRGILLLAFVSQTTPTCADTMEEGRLSNDFCIISLFIRSHCERVDIGAVPGSNCLQTPRYR